MLKFAVSRQTLPSNYLSKTNKMDLKNFDVSKITALVKNRYSNSKDPSIPDNHNERKKIPEEQRTSTKRKAVSDPAPDDIKKANTEPGPGHLKRSITVQMRVWSSQLSRIKKRTESLRQKDQEIKERFQKIQQRAKRVFSMVEAPTFRGVHDGETPRKRARLMSGDNVLYYGNNCLLLQKIDKEPRKPPVPARRHKSGSDIPSRASFDDLLGCSPIPYPRTFMKNGHKCTKC